jgi:uncharacterized lipoprotein YddW (UPF0748 family)
MDEDQEKMVAKTGEDKMYSVNTRREIRNNEERSTFLSEAMERAMDRIKKLRPDEVLGISKTESDKMKGMEKVDFTQNYQDWVSWAFEEVKKLQSAGSLADDLVAMVAEDWKKEYASKRTS